jgi:N-methylhydantoinase A/oxoprolinase/acetone carboxylase beta subunit
LVTEGLAFGGSSLTATDLLVAAGKATVGPDQCPVQLPAETVANGLRTIQSMLNQGIEKMMPSSDPMPVVLVGGGAILVADKLEAASEMYCPEHSGVANAIGAAIAQIGGEVERLVSYREIPREEAIKKMSEEARLTAINAGADANTIRIADIEETTISYMAEGSTRLRIKAVGDISRDTQGVKT